jgi:aspartate/methionine/tyrosine aminotransferase
MLLTPEGKPVGNANRMMLQAQWARQLQFEQNSNPGDSRQPIILACLGKPSFPMNAVAAQSANNYWQEKNEKTRKAREYLNSTQLITEETRNKVAKMGAAIDYGDLRGDLDARVKMAIGLSHWYGASLNIRPEHILFTVGGAAALHNIFTVVNRIHPHGFIVTPFPRHTLYEGPNKSNNLFPIQVMKEKGYRITAEVLKDALGNATTEAKKRGIVVSTLVLCDPYNPTGTTLDEQELDKICQILKSYPELIIVLDEAYAEMRFDGKLRLSLLKVAPELKNRIVLMRTATKMLSAAGERMAVTVAFNNELMTQLADANSDLYGHTPRSLQHAFADAMMRLDNNELNSITDYYQPQVRYLEHRLKSMGASMPDQNYKVESTFYVLADVSDLLGLEIPKEVNRALPNAKVTKTSEDIAYYLLFKDRIVISPLSYFGVKKNDGYVRITCCGGEEELRDLADRLENRLIEARKQKQVFLKNELALVLNKIMAISPTTAKIISMNVEDVISGKNTTAINLMKNNKQLQDYLSESRIHLGKFSDEEKNKYAIKIQSQFRGYKARKHAHQSSLFFYENWKMCVEKYFSDNKVKRDFLQFTPSQRLQFTPWIKHLKKMAELDKLSTENQSIQPKIISKL